MGTTADKLAKLNETKADLKSALSEKGVTVGNVFSTYPDAVRSIPSGGKRTCRFVIGTSAAGWTADDCDYLCDGADDQEQFNAAIAALPENGGEILVLDGTYTISNTISISRNNVCLTGNGDGTKLVYSIGYPVVPMLSSGYSARIRKMSISYTGLDTTNFLTAAYLSVSQAGAQVSFSECGITAIPMFCVSGSNGSLAFAGCEFESSYETMSDNYINFNRYSLFNHCRFRQPAKVMGGGCVSCCEFKISYTDTTTYSLSLSSYGAIAQGCRIEGVFGVQIMVNNCVLLGNSIFLTEHDFGEGRIGIRASRSGSVVSGNTVAFDGAYSDFDKTIELYGTTNSVGNVVTGNVLYGADVIDNASQTVKANNSVITA